MQNKPIIVIAGGSGFFGSYLCDFFSEKYQVVVLTRGKTQGENGVKYQHWDGKNVGDWKESLEGALALVNLSGKSINCRFTEENKKALINSRVNTTQILAKGIKSVVNPPKVWLNASAGAMYIAGEKPNTEDDKEFADSFLSKMALAWEEAFYKDELPKTKRASLRISLILGKEGGVFPVLKKITGMYLGGKAGNGKQKMSWIHINDAARAVEFIIQNQLEGPVNFSSNKPLSNQQFMQKFRQAMNVSFGMPAPAFGIKIGSYFMGTEPSLLLDSVNFIPQKLNDKGFDFEYDKLKDALVNLLADE